MADDKRELRKLKREIKKLGNRRRRRWQKDLEAEPDDFDYGRDRSDMMNEPRPNEPPENDRRDGQSAEGDEDA